MSKQKLLAAAVVAVVVVGVLGVSSQVLPKRTTDYTAVTLLLAFIPDGSSVGIFTALGKGYYAEEGLSLDVSNGKGSGFSNNMIDQKKFDFALSQVPTTIQFVERGAKVKVVMVYSDSTSIAAVAFKDKGIKTVKDLEGRTIALQPASATLFMLKGWVTANGGDPNKVKVELVDTAVQDEGFLTGKWDVTTSYLDSSLPAVQDKAKKLGKELNVLSFKDTGFDFYGLGLMAHPDTLLEKPDLVKKVIRATIKGVKYAWEHPEEATDLTLKYNPEMNGPYTLQAWKNIMELMRTDTANKVGYGKVDLPKMQKTIDIMLQAGMIKAKNDPASIYTNEFI